MPGNDTYERDTELLIIGKKIKDTKNPTKVAGDLNVGWFVTSKLLRKYSELVDPREGRGLYNTYNVFCLYSGTNDLLCTFIKHNFL